ncbi:hypothetical protein TW81_03795 [Vibrio galatheae]|uniref:diguanylate cyclase n=1 Tax=Vibrio galatheae TaxID=579748 RepID=A0A0F4NRD5_9VIBR|nr:GGDEF domain-containing protein [Vibrio galatheae]KJY84661.1 hypothetical protein TW81_03795 [Vibrio galatheae]
MKKIKLNRANLIIKSLMIAFFTYWAILFSYSYLELEKNKSQFKMVTDKVESQKQLLTYTTLFINTILKVDRSNLNHMFSDTEKPKLNTYIYPIKGKEKELNPTEKLITLSTMYSFRQSNRYLFNTDSSIYLQSYSDNRKLIFFNDVGNVTLADEAHHDERCLKYKLCSKFSTKDQISDGVVVSRVYTDMISELPTVTLSSPIFDSYNIIGDLSSDLYISGNYFDNKATFRSGDIGDMNYISINYPQYPLSELGFRSNYVIDNKTILVYNYPISKPLLETIWVFYFVWIVCFLLMNHYQRLRHTKVNFHKIYEDSQRDDVTGLYNRKVFNSSKFLKRTHDKTLAIIAIDGNKLKKINDEYGHHIGDEAIKHIANSMKVTFRENDFLVRLGGDEFVAILPDCTSSRAFELKEQLKNHVPSKKLKYANIEVNVSVGVAFKSPSDDLEQALILADENLYLDKNNRYD